MAKPRGILAKINTKYFSKCKFFYTLAANQQTMAILSGAINFTGPLGNLSVYELRNTGKIVVRQKGGPSREKVKKHSSFELTRKYNAEWKACIETAKQLNRSLCFIKHVAGYNYTGSLNGLCKSIQKEDNTSPVGQRPVLVSRYGHKLAGFTLNRENGFESIVKHPLQYSLDKDNGTALIQVPEIVPGISLYNPRPHPLYRLVFVLGTVADMVYNAEQKRYSMATDKPIHPVVVSTAWHGHREKMEALEISITLESYEPHPQLSLVLAACIEFGTPVSQSEIRPIKYSGAAKIVTMEGGEW